MISIGWGKCKSQLVGREWHVKRLERVGGAAREQEKAGEGKGSEGSHVGVYRER